MGEAASKPAILSEARAKNSSLTHGLERHAMLKKLLQADHTITIEGLINSPELQPTK
jgi:hypothetical protein